VGREAADGLLVADLLRDGVALELEGAHAHHAHGGLQYGDLNREELAGLAIRLGEDGLWGVVGGNRQISA
jgi:hypothetical protein